MSTLKSAAPGLCSGHSTIDLSVFAEGKNETLQVGADSPTLKAGAHQGERTSAEGINIRSQIHCCTT